MLTNQFINRIFWWSCLACVLFCFINLVKTGITHSYSQPAAVSILDGPTEHCRHITYLQTNSFPWMQLEGTSTNRQVVDLQTETGTSWAAMLGCSTFCLCLPTCPGRIGLCRRPGGTSLPACSGSERVETLPQSLWWFSRSLKQQMYKDMCTETAHKRWGYINLSKIL